MKIFTITVFLFSSFLVQGQITWQEKTGPYGGRISDVEFHSPSGKFFAIGGQTYTPYVSTNGSSWSVLTVNGAPDNGRPTEFFIDADNNIYLIYLDGDLFRSTDGGNSFSLLNPTSKFNHGYKMAKNSTGLFILGYTNASLPVVWKSTNGGVVWTEGYQGAPGAKFEEIIVNDQDQIFITSAPGEGKIYRSDDGGTIFNLKMTGITSGDQVESITTSANRASLFALTQNAIYISINDGDTWTAVTTTGLVASGSGDGLLFTTADNQLFFINNNVQDIYSISMTGNPPQPTAASWTSRSSSFAPEITSVAVVSSSNFLLGQFSGISRTTTCCAAVSDAFEGVKELRMEDMIVANNNNLLIATGSGLLLSSNDGQSWSKPNTGAQPFYNPRLLKNTTNGEIYLYGTGAGQAQKSASNGSSWAVHITPPDNAIYQYATHDGIKIFGVSAGKVHYSNNSGTGWQTGGGVSVTGSLPTNYQIDDFEIDLNFNLYIKILNYDAGREEIHKVVLTPNPSVGTPTTAVGTRIDGSTGYTISDLEQRPLEVNGNTIYLLGRNAGNSKHVLNFSADGGASWTSKDATGGFDLEVASNGYIFITQSNFNSGKQTFQLNFSRDGGNSYIATNAIPRPSSAGYVETLLDADGYLYALIDYSSLYKSTNKIVTPAMPSGLTVVSKGTTGAILRWNDASDQEIRYEIQKFDGSDYDSIASVEVNSSFDPQHFGYFKLNNLQPNTAYEYRVFAVNEAGYSEGATINFTTLNTCTSTIPDNRSWNGVTANQSGLGVFNGTNISIKKLANNYYSISDISAGSVNAITGNALIPAKFFESCGEAALDLDRDDDLLPNGNGTWNGTSLKLRWRTNPSDVEEFDEITLTVNLNDPTPGAPLDVAAYNYSDNSIEVTWKAVAFEKKFTVERSTVAGGPFSVAGTVDYPSQSFIDNGPLTPNTTYFYRVKSQNGNAIPGESGYSNVAELTFKKPNLVIAQTTINNTPLNSLGAIWSDFNNDGFDDLVLTKFDFASFTQSIPLFFQNTGASNFTPVAVNLNAANHVNGTTADYDNDGDIDIFYSTIGEPSKLYNGNGTFSFTKVDPTAVSEQAGTGLFGIPFSAAWIDYNNDGLLDLFVGRNGGSNSVLFRQNTDHTFTKTTSAGDLVNTIMRVFGMAWTDYDNDGDIDVFIVDQNASQTSKLFKNNNDGTFTKVTGSVFDADVGIEPQSASWADFDNDQDMDLFLGTQLGTNRLYRNQGNGTFAKLVLPAFDVSTTGETLGSSWADINNDGFIDLIVASQQGNQLFLNSNGTSFSKVSGEKIADTQLATISVAGSDFNNDGFIDFALSRTTIEGEGEAGIPQNSLLFKNNNTTGNWLKVKLTGSTSNRSAIGARARITIGSQHQTREVSSHIGIGSQNSLTLHFGLGAATKADQLVITWPSGIVQTLSNVNANQTISITEDAAGPVIITRAPLHAAVTVPLQTSFNLTLNETATAIAGKKLNVYTAGNLSTPVFSLDVTAATKTDNTYTFTLPVGQALQSSTNYVITIDAGAFKDVFGNEFAGIAAGTWSFTTVDPPDATAPVITFTPATTLPKGFGSVSPSITVTDNKQVSTVQLSIRAISGTTYATVNATAGATPNTWGVTLTEATHFDATGSEFFVTATDAAGNTTRSPEGTATHKVLLTYNENESKIPSERLGFGGQKANWKVFAIPFDLGTNNAVTSVFNEFSGLTNKVDYRMITYGSETAWSEYPTGFATIARGTGYFINIKEPIEIKIGNSLTAPQNSRSNLFQMSLKQGWNMVGNPYLTSISWADVAAYNSLTGTSAQLKKFSNGQYSNNQSLSSYEGGFVFASAATTISIPFLGQTTAGGREGFRDLDTDIDAEAWALPIALSQGEFTYSLGAVGMAPDASASFDQHDDVTPPRFFDYLELNFSHPEHFAKRFTRDVVPTQSAYTWSLTVNSNLPGQAHLTWDNMSLSHAQNDIFLLDIARQKLVNMKETGSYFFDPKESGNFRIYFGSNLQVAPESVFLGKAYPNPTSGLTTVGFSLPESGGWSQEVSLDLIDAMGKTAGTISQGSYIPGYHEVSWDAKTLSSGFYTYRITVNGKQGRTTQISKLIIK